MRVGLFGGTFDPPHLGHLVTAVNVRHVLKLDLVILMVANDPWQKHGTREVASASDRLAMVQAAIDGVDGLLAGDDEITRGGPSYTADTLAVCTSDTAMPRFLQLLVMMRPPNLVHGRGLMKSQSSRHWLLLTDPARRCCHQANLIGIVSKCRVSK